MRIHFEYKNYPMSKELTEKSKLVGRRTHPVCALALSVLPTLLMVFLAPDYMHFGLIASAVMVVPCIILMKKHREKKFAQFDAEYAKLLQSRR